MMTSYQEQIFFHYILKNHMFLEVTKPDFFSNKTLKELFSIAKEHAIKYKEAPSKQQLIELINIKGEAEKYSNDILDGLYNTENLLDQYGKDWLEKNVGPWIQVRNLDNVMRKAIAYMTTTKVTAENASEVVENIRSMLTTETAIDFGFNMGSDFYDPTAHLQSRLARTSSGYNYIDLCLKGGYWKGSLITLLSGPKAGKCVVGGTKIKIRNKSTGEIKNSNIGKFHEFQKFSDLQDKIDIGTKEYIEKKDKKFIEVFKINNWEVETESGWQDIKASGKTIQYNIWEIQTDNGYVLKCADNHIVISNNKEIYVKDLLINDAVDTISGPSKIISINKSDKKVNMYDIEVDSDNHTYYTDGILSHNSTWLGNMSLKSSQMGFNTAYITFELQEEIVNMRIGANLFSVPIDDYEEWAKDQDRLKNKIKAVRSGSLEQPGVMHVKEFGASTCSVNDLKNYLKKAEEVLGIKFDNIFVDYINIMKNWRNPNTENTYMKIKQIAEDLRAMAMEERWAVITATQTNRSGWESTDLNITNISESAALLHTVDVLFGIITTAEMKAAGEYYLKCLANRVSGYENTKKRFTIEWKYSRIEEDRNSQIQDMDFEIEPSFSSSFKPNSNNLNKDDSIKESEIIPETNNSDIKVTGGNLFDF